jgi:hypothetical protein
MAMGMTHSLTEMSTSNIPGVGVKVWPVRKAENLTVISETVVWKVWKPRRLTTVCISLASDRLFCFLSTYLFNSLHSNYKVTTSKVRETFTNK